MKNRFANPFLIFSLMFAIALVSVLAVFATETPSDSAKITGFIIESDGSAKTEYLEGEHFDPTGFTGIVSYSDGSTVTIPSSDLVFSPADPLNSNTTKIEFTYGNSAYKTDITVHPYTGLEVTGTSEYLAFDVIDKSALNVSLVFGNGTTVPVSVDDCEFSPSLDMPLSKNTTGITVSYTLGLNTKMTTFALSVKPICSLEIYGLEGVNFYESTHFTAPETMVVTAYYDDNKTESKIISAPTIKDADSTLLAPDANGNATLTLDVDGTTLDFTVPVISITDFEVDLGTAPSAYYYGDTFTKEGITVYALYGEGVKIDVTESVIFTAPDMIIHGSVITAALGEKNIELPISLPVGELEILVPPTKLEYSVGDTFDPTGMRVFIKYNDNSTIKELLVDDLSIEPDAVLTADDDVITISYYGLSEFIAITVGDTHPFTSIIITSPPTKLSYFTGESLDITGLLVHAYYDGDSTPYLIDPADLIITPALGTMITADMTEVKIELRISSTETISATFPIEVEEKTISGIAVTKQPAKKEYNEGDYFKPDGMQVSLIYNDGTTVVITDYTTPAETFILASNTKQTVNVKVVYQNFECTVPVTVNPSPVSKLTLAVSPLKVKYAVGESFDPAGLRMVLTYSDSTVANIVPDGYYSYYPAGALSADDKEIIISFRGLELVIPITVGNGTSSDTTTDNSSTTTTPPDVNTNPSDTNAPPDVNTSDPSDTTKTPDVTTVPDDTGNSTDPSDTTNGSDTTDSTGGDGDGNSLLALWIAIIAIIVIALVALIIYYKRNFT